MTAARQAHRGVDALDSAALSYVVVVTCDGLIAKPVSILESACSVLDAGSVPESKMHVVLFVHVMTTFRLSVCWPQKYQNLLCCLYHSALSTHTAQPRLKKKELRGKSKSTINALEIDFCSPPAQDGYLRLPHRHSRARLSRRLELEEHAARPRCQQGLSCQGAGQQSAKHCALRQAGRASA